jgi:hypothetical protein
MNCLQCQQENPPQAKFCMECAASLIRACTECQTQLPGAAKFCPECAHPVSTQSTSEPQYRSPEVYTPRHLAEKIHTSKSALEGERKQVTVLFADLKGSMELLADRDPEESRTLLNAVVERMMEAVHRYEGTVNNVMGDGIMATFGAPLAHEDHALRACYAALRMQDAVNRFSDEAQRTGALPVVEKTQGNPFFKEEVVQTLVEDKVLVGGIGNYRLEKSPSELEIPPTVQVALASRIDRLGLDEKGLLQTLAVMGRKFSLSLLKVLVEQPEEELHRLVASATGRGVHLRAAGVSLSTNYSASLCKKTPGQTQSYLLCIWRHCTMLNGKIGLKLAMRVDRSHSITLSARYSNSGSTARRKAKRVKLSALGSDRVHLGVAIRVQRACDPDFAAALGGGWAAGTRPRHPRDHLGGPAET